MNKYFIRIILILFLMTGGVLAAQAEEMNSPPKPQGSMKPPPEAITACKGKSEGTAVQFTTPRGDTLKGVCRQFEGVLARLCRNRERRHREAISPNEAKSRERINCFQK
jgi:hypothetical protein